MMENVTIFGVIFGQNGAKSSPPCLPNLSQMKNGKLRPLF